MGSVSVVATMDSVYYIRKVYLRESFQTTNIAIGIGIGNKSLGGKGRVRK